MTCISHFYQAGASSYVALHGRIHHLQQGKQHLEAYLEERRWSGASTRSRHPSWGRDKEDVVMKLIMTPTEVAK